MSAFARRDASATVVEVAVPPSRIVSLVPSYTETLFALGLGPRIVGVTLFCTEPRAEVRQKAIVGREKDPDIGRILALHPDLVVANIEENRRDVVERLRDEGVPVWVAFPRTLAEGIAGIRDLGALTGAVEAATALASRLEARRGALARRLAGREPVRVFCPIWRNPYMTVGGDTYVSDVIAATGGVNVYAAATRYPEVSLEAVAATRPEVILLPDEPYRFRPAHLTDFAPHPTLQKARVHFVDGKLLTWYGPRIEEALERLPELLLGPEASRAPEPDPPG